MVPRPAATVMLLRPEARAGFAVYMLRRSLRSRFVPDVYVFPGGAVDAADRELAASPAVRGSAGPDAPEIAVAALRETFEEAGILLAVARDGASLPVGGPELGTLRAELLGGVPLRAILDRHGLALDAGALTYYSNLITPVTEPIRFDAHFFLARAPEDQIAAADAIEVHDGIWISPVDALERAERGELSIIFPTLKHLERLAAQPDIDAALADARSRPVKPMMPFEREKGVYAFAPGDEW
jgi:8-oxo-dGTP pyrophosphatase MutT (NUDIX family)